MNKKFKCCFTDCSYKSDSLLQVLEHMKKIHKLEWTQMPPIVQEKCK